MHKRLLLLGMVSASMACSKGGGSATAETACEHLVSLAGMPPEKCQKDMEEMKKELGEAKFGEFTSCVVKAKKKEDLALCIPKQEMVEYMNKSKAVEAKLSLRKMADGARAHYMDGHLGDGLDMVPAAPTLPESVGPTPAKGGCCGEFGKCAPDSAQWEHPTWQALSFAMYDPHYFSYEYKRNDDGKGFVLSAYGDLDCDGTYSTYTLAGTVEAEGEISLGKVEGKDELE